MYSQFSLFSFIFSRGVHYPVHPLDLSTISSPVTLNGQQYIACISAFVSADANDLSSSGFDVALGDSFLRNVYSMYVFMFLAFLRSSWLIGHFSFDFGDTAADGTTSDPYIQLLSTLDPAKAISEVTTIRGQTLASLPPEMDPATFVNLITSSESSTAPAASLNSDNHDSVHPSSSASPNSHSLTSDKTISASHFLATISPVKGPQTVSTDGNIVDKYGMAIVGLLAANLFIGFVLLVFVVLPYTRKGALSKKNPSGRTVYVPVKGIDQDEGYGFSQTNLNRYSSWWHWTRCLWKSDLKSSFCSHGILRCYAAAVRKLGHDMMDIAILSAQYFRL